MLYYIPESKKRQVKSKQRSFVFRFSDKVDERLFHKFENFCHEKFHLTQEGSCTLFYYVNSPGGDLGWAAKIVELLNAFNAKKIAIAYEKVHSSAVTIFAAGTVRIAKKSSTKFLFHRAVKEQDIPSEDILSGEHSAFSFIADQCNCSVETIYALASDETYLDVTKAKSLGLIHEILN